MFFATDYILFASENYKIFPVNKEFTLDPSERFEQDLPFDENRPSIVVAGCSYTYGTSIDQNETFAYKLQQYTGRKVYNYGQPGTGVQHVLYKIENAPLFNDKNFNPEYVIYVFISDHLQRLYYDFSPDSQNKYLGYKVKKTEKTNMIWRQNIRFLQE